MYQGNVGIAFADLRGFLTNNNSLFGANLGGGYRYYSAPSDRIWGANIFYDHRDTGLHSFNQVGFGFETLGSSWDARTNVYLVTGHDQRETSAFFDNPVFVQHFIQLDRVATGQGAMSGFDAEVGAPISCAIGLKAYVGTYNFQVSNSPQAWGIKGRIEERVNDNLDLSLTYANDQVFGNSIIFQAGYRFGGRRSRTGSSRCDTYARRADRIERNHQIVVTDQVIVTHELACDPNSPTHAPIFVEHVASYVAPGGDGTVEHPFMTLGQVQAASSPGNIIFAWANSNFAGQSIALKDKQRFLGEGASCPHFFTACQGTFLLPRATTLAAQPIISGSAADAVTLANNNEVSGFNIVNPTGSGVFGSGIADYNINCNTITGAGQAPIGDNGDGIQLINASGRGIITNNTISGSRQNGIDLTSTSGGVTNATITGNTFNTNGLAGILAESQSGSQLNLVVNGTNTSNGDGAGVALVAFGGGSALNASITGMTVNNPGAFGFGLASVGFSSGTTTLTAQVTNNTVTGTPIFFGFGATSLGTGSTLCLGLHNNTSSGSTPFVVGAFGGTTKLESDSAALVPPTSNSAPVLLVPTIGSITIVPNGSCVPY